MFMIPNICYSVDKDNAVTHFIWYWGSGQVYLNSSQLQKSNDTIGYNKLHVKEKLTIEYFHYLTFHDDLKI